MLKNYLVLSRIKILVSVTIILTICLQSYGAKKSEKGILLVAFGTSIPRAKKSYNNIDRVVKKSFPDTPVYWAYTSSFIRRKLAKKGIKTDSITEALNKMNKDGIKQVTAQSLHITNGSEYEEIIRESTPFNKKFKSINIGMPMLISATDLNAFSKALKSVIPTDREKTDAIVLMGHGNHHGIGDFTFIAATHELKKQDRNIFVGTVEGKPTFEEMLQSLKKSGAKKVYLIPLMVVAGDHAINDLAGPESDSWKTMLEKDDFKCIPVLKGLGENDKMVAIFIAHLKKAMNTKKKKK